MTRPELTPGQRNPKRKSPIEEMDEELLRFVKSNANIMGFVIEGAVFWCIESGPVVWRYIIEARMQGAPTLPPALLEVMSKAAPEDGEPFIGVIFPRT